MSVTVSDRGEVIAPEVLGRIFDKFYQGDTSHGVKGNGLGLAVAAKIVDLHKGSISVIRSDEEQTAFEVRLGADRHYKTDKVLNYYRKI